MSNEHVRAAGCVVWRRSPEGYTQVLVAHRPRYDDWSHPKGKRDPGETDLECALREVREETGFSGIVGAELPEVRYRDQKNRDKVVRYWLMEQTEGTFRPNDEVDEIRWLDPAEARESLTYAHDKELIDHLP